MSDEEKPPVTPPARRRGMGRAKSARLVLDSSDLDLSPRTALSKPPTYRLVESDEDDGAPRQRQRVHTADPDVTVVGEDEDEGAQAPKAAKETENAAKILYNIKLFQYSQLKEEITKRKFPKTRTVQWSVAEPFDTIKGKLCAVATGLRNELSAAYKDYEVTYTIPRRITSPTALLVDSDYEVLISQASLVKTTPATVNVFMCPLKKPNDTKRKTRDSDDSSPPRKSKKKVDTESDDSTDDDKSRKKRKKKKKGKGKDVKDAMELPLNKQKVDFIRQLQEKYACTTHGGYCLFTTKHPNHYALKHPHLDIWAAALMTDNDNIATLEKPPNYVEFETWPGYEVAGPTSPILERRAQLLRDRNKGTAANAGTVINFYGDKMDAATTSAAAAPAPALSITPSSSAPLVEGPSGPHMPIKDFVTKYQLSSTLSDKLIENGYESTRAMSLIELPQLSEMEFKPGHIASLRVAIKDWQADA